jgi:hypothetical protein
MTSPASPTAAATPDFWRDHIEKAVLARISTTPERRQEALHEFFRVTRPDLGEQAAAALAESVPPLIPELHASWAAMFAARLVETVPAEQVAHLCDGSPENGASLTLAYLMFLESERMEKQIAADLEAYRREHPEVAQQGRELTDKVLTRRDADRRRKAASYAGDKKRRMQ